MLWQEWERVRVRVRVRVRGLELELLQLVVLLSEALLRDQGRLVRGLGA